MPKIDLTQLRLSLATLDEILALRHAVLRPGLPRESAIFAGDHDADTRHFGAFIGDRNVGCASIMLNEHEGKAAWQLRGMATDPAFQGAGVGAALLREVEKFVRKNPPHELWCNARMAAVGFYVGQEWMVCSEEFMIEGVGPHHRMSKSVSPA